MTTPPITLAAVPAIKVEIIATRGSTPRDVGATLWVSDEAIFGTIGGGQLEYQVINQAKEMLAAGISQATTASYKLGAQCGQCCGGHVSLQFSHAVLPPPWDPSMNTVWDHYPPYTLLPVMVLGAGHVGRALIRLLGNLPCQVIWVDNREAEFNRYGDKSGNTFGTPIEASIPANVWCEWVEKPQDAIATAKPNTAFVVTTHRHDWDFDLVRAILMRGDSSFVGMIASTTKAQRCRLHLEARGIDSSRLHSPIGLPGLRGKEPEVIALSIASALMQVRPFATSPLKPSEDRSIAPLETTRHG